MCAKSAASQILIWAQKNPLFLKGGKRSKPRGVWLKGTSKPSRFLVQWGVHKQDYTFTNALDVFYEQKRRPDLSAAIVIDLTRLADHLVKAAGRPLATLADAS